ncbi:hypothetical protein QQS21_008621 [Conoideocrella luteorostrata]|uniref:Uncharacterized protein n=1 Tax=Conoideocrella luteorostrata TaxID=1105319 RepID=A0AAJ0CIJ1_9HYPO|nr:hypothetical protein QQS21_008621 [Conoideocrella luteorostrata]
MSFIWGTKEPDSPEQGPEVMPPTDAMLFGSDYVECAYVEGADCGLVLKWDIELASDRRQWILDMVEDPAYVAAVQSLQTEAVSVQHRLRLARIFAHKVLLEAERRGDATITWCRMDKTKGVSKWDTRKDIRLEGVGPWTAIWLYSDMCDAATWGERRGGRQRGLAMPWVKPLWYSRGGTPYEYAMMRVAGGSIYRPDACWLSVGYHWEKWSPLQRECVNTWMCLQSVAIIGEHSGYVRRDGKPDDCVNGPVFNNDTGTEIDWWNSLRDRVGVLLINAFITQGQIEEL